MQYPAEHVSNGFGGGLSWKEIHIFSRGVEASMGEHALGYYGLRHSGKKIRPRQFRPRQFPHELIHAQQLPLQSSLLGYQL